MSVGIEEIAKKGERIYVKKEKTLSAAHKGEYMAIQVDTGDYFLGETGGIAIEKAKKRYPEDVFYLVKIGFSATQTLASMSRTR
ncbi:MAG: hypothetical protein A3E36_01775 [Candidatus Andersenbacteria bacterium RIFCSPHIGHO2_12_FULL_45_11b]|uniref:DUF5678 domain-containing protein n=1 Tax=Candidatus Andersenbacteria bacterium RIFCSPHIGHO2_12_FULL_45_11b TaxID=1797282 RepID=A0A1G1X7P9_9BACT|nr:MAG: hypothetical protein A3E36_01775 [Candidatus Andersenbacteria bacterium RIFCSPHIGHO2_12_FULL_45_11b]